MSKDLTLVHNMPATKVLSASTDDGGILNRELNTSCRPRLRTPLYSKMATSLLMAAS